MLVQSNRRFALNLILVLFAAIFLLIFVIQICASENPLWLLLGRSFASAITITFLLTNWPRCYSFLVRQNNRISFLSPLLDLNGEWRVDIHSNWPRIQMLSKQSERQLPLKKITGTLKLRCDFFQTQGYFQVDDKNSDRSSLTRKSDIVASSLRKENGHYLFSYIAKASVSDPDTITDEQNYLFSTEIGFHDGDVNHGYGQYWTNRKYSTGHNAAGEIQLTRK